MPNIYLMVGLPGSGKSTRAKEMFEQYGNIVRVNRDLLREMLHFGRWSPKNERLVIEAEKTIIKVSTQNGLGVILDDTNLGKSHYDMWTDFVHKLNLERISRGEDIAVSLVNVFMDTSVEECILRDSVREKGVGEWVIKNMARKYGLLTNDKKDCIIDIDGTLADLTHRLHFIKDKDPKDWNSFFDVLSEDSPIQENIDYVKELSKDFNIVIVSGRPDNYRDQTVSWLKKYDIPFQTIIMRRARDRRQDDIVKGEILKNYFNKDNIHLIMDDRPSVIKMWRSHGLNVKDVGKGIEF